ESAKKLSALGISFDEVNEFIKSGTPTPELDTILKNLGARGLADFVKVDYYVIRGLAYYTGVVFEAFDRKGEFRAIAGGGRYDNLVKLISGGKVNLPALGFGMGDVVLLELLKARKLLPDFNSRTDLVVLVEDETLRMDSLRLVQDLRSFFSVDYSLTAAKGERQFKRAMEAGAIATAKWERDPSGHLKLKLRLLSTRQEATVDSVPEAVAFLRGSGSNSEFADSRPPTTTTEEHAL